MPSLNFLLRTSAGLGALAIAMAATTAQAQNNAADGAVQSTGLSDIIVTASRMGATQLQATPIAVSAMSADELSDRGVRDVQDLKTYVPSLQVSDMSGYTQLYLRGIGSNIVFIGSDPSTTLHLDGVYMARPLAYAQDFLDVERVEVLRGPQGTLYGRNSVGGTINVISKKPAEELEAKVQAGFGNYSRYAAQGYISGPLGEGVRASLAVDVSGHGAYRKNISTGNDVESMRSRGLRGQLYFPVGDTGEWTVRADWSRQAGSLGGYPKLLEATGIPEVDSILGDYSKVAMNDDNWTVLNNAGLSSDLVIPISDNVSLKSLTAYRTFTGSIVSDADGSPLPLQHTKFVPIRQRQLSQELTLNGSLGALDFVVGGFYFNEVNREPLTLTLDIVPGIVEGSHIQRPRIKSESYALFGQGEFHLSDQFSIIAGLRWTDETKHYTLTDYFTTSTNHDRHVAESAPIITGSPIFPDPFNVDVKRGYDAFTPKFGINFKPNDDVLLYASVTRGFKSGGFDYGSNNAYDASLGYGPEKLWSYEAGLKSDWFDRRLRFNLTGFYYDYTDLQVQSLVQIGASLGARTQNAATATVKGIEAEFTAQPVQGLTLIANGTWLDAKYDKYPNAIDPDDNVFDASGKRLINAPKWSGTVGFNYVTELGDAGAIDFGADAHIQSKVFFTAANDGVGAITGYSEQQKGYTVVNGRIGWTAPDDRLRIQVIATNIFNRDYLVGTASYGLVNSGRPGRPREVFGQISYSF